jgi:cytochrome c-type biogenesis protein CcmE
MKRAKLKRALIIITLLSSISAGVWIVMSNLNQNIMFFYTPTDIQTSTIRKQNIRVGGIVKPHSIKKFYKNKKHIIAFTITDSTNDIIIHYQGILPSLFREGQGIVAIGRMVENNIFISEKLLAKHDENYTPKKPVDSKSKISLCNPKSFKR